MKRSVIIMAVLAFSLFACGQKPPKSVTDNFNSKFAGATKVNWDQEEDNEWEVEFKMNGSEMSASFDNDGTWLETESEIEEKDLPTVVKAKLAMNYWGYEMKEVEKMEKPGFSGYEIAIAKGEEKLEIQVNPVGIIVNVKEVEVDED